MQRPPFMQPMRDVVALLRNPMSWALLFAMVALFVGHGYFAVAIFDDGDLAGFAMVAVLQLAIFVLYGVIVWAFGYYLLADMRGRKGGAVVRFIGLYILYSTAAGVLAVLLMIAITELAGVGSLVAVFTVGGMILPTLVLFPALVRLKMLAARIEQPRIGALWSELFGFMLPYLGWLVLLSIPVAALSAVFIDENLMASLDGNDAMPASLMSVLTALLGFLQGILATAAARRAAATPRAEAEVFD